uniref:ARAD1A13134p n=1 Tax=Blastobotrys adeninivorans TaxID=409370 RepID=A0A060T342_BLAAD
MMTVTDSIPTMALTHLLQVIQLESKTPVAYAVSHKKVRSKWPETCPDRYFSRKLTNITSTVGCYYIYTYSCYPIHLIHFIRIMDVSKFGA